MRSTRVAPVLLSLAVVVACSSDDTPPAGGGGTSDVVLRPNAHVLSTAELTRISSIAPDGTITFASRDPALDALIPDDVIVGGIAAATPRGLLRRITRVERTSAGLVFGTKPAALPDVIASGKLHLSRVLKSGDISTATEVVPGTGFYVALDNVVLYDGGSAGTRVTANGNISFEPSIDLDVDIDLGGVHRLAFTVGGSQGATIDLTTGASLQFDEKKEVATYNFVPFVIEFGPVPVVFAPRLILEVGASGHVDAASTVSIVEQSQVKLGLAYESGSISPIASAEPTYSFGGPSVVAGASVKAWAGGRAELLIYDVLGPYGTIDGYLKLDAAPAATPCWALTAGVESRFGLTIDVFGLKLVDTDTNVLDRSTPLASGTCKTPVIPPPGPWAYAFTRVGSDNANAVDGMPDGGLVVAGDASADAAVTRIGADGAIVWQRRFPIGVIAQAVRATGDHVFVAGDSWVAKLDAKTGNVLWSNRYGSDPEVRAIDATPDGGCIVAGLTVSPTVDFDYWFAKLSASGAVQWSKRMGDAKWEQVNAVRHLDGGGYILAGQYAPNQDADAFLARLDDAAGVLFQKRYAGTGTFESFDAVLPQGDAFVVTGRAQRPAGGSGWVVRLGGSGNVAWSKAFGETGSDYLTSIVATPTGYLATGSTGILPTRAWAVGLDTSGHPLWSRAYGATGANQNVTGRGLALWADGTFAFGGQTNAFGDSDTFAVHATFDGHIDFASGFALAQLSGTTEAPYPAPATTTTSPVVDYPITPAPLPATPVTYSSTAKKLTP
ncbi:MAG: PQQ-binding-like beta-propeller repeat protein [Labilithrix sp.]